MSALQARMATRLAALSEEQCRELLAQACAQFNRVRAACDEVVATTMSVPMALLPDMLEVVLSHVGTLTLHRAMRVNRDWCGVARRPQLHRVIAINGVAPRFELGAGSSCTVDPADVGPQQLSDGVILNQYLFGNESLARCISLAKGGLVELRLSHLYNLHGTAGFQLLRHQTSFKVLDMAFCPFLDAHLLPLVPSVTTYLSIFQCAPIQSESLASLPNGLAGRCVECENILSFQLPPTSSEIARMRLRACDACGACRCDGDPEPCGGA
jgi:hypothetical protein